MPFDVSTQNHGSENLGYGADIGWDALRLGASARFGAASIVCDLRKAT